MKIRTSLALKYTSVTAIVFLFCMLTVYCLSVKIRRNTFFHTLKSEAVTKAHLFLSRKADAETMHSVYWNNQSFIHEVEVAVYTSDGRLVYHDAVAQDRIKETPQLIREICEKKELEWNLGNDQAVGLVYLYQGTPYVVTAVAYDGYGYRNLHDLRTALLVLYVLGLLILFATGFFLSYIALKPIRLLVRETEQITASRMSRRIPMKSHDEIGELAHTFNELLARLETSFNAQKEFVGHASHELRTPLSALTAELDLALQRERTPEQYRQALRNALGDARKMNRLITGLLDLAKTDYGTGQIRMEEIRLDELLMEVRALLLRAQPSYHIELVFAQEPEDEHELIVWGNRYLLRVALTNLMENNCKYSGNHTSFIQISFWKQSLILRFSDNGIGMSAEELRHVYTLFYRGEHHQSYEGHGIGMTLVRKIVDLHQGQISVSSEPGKGTTFILELPHV